MVAVTEALQVLGYFESLQSEEVPPRRYWHNQERLTEWFDAVKEKRTMRAQGMEPIDEVEEGSEMVENELARGLRG